MTISVELKPCKKCNQAFPLLRNYTGRRYSGATHGYVWIECCNKFCDQETAPHRSIDEAVAEWES